MSQKITESMPAPPNLSVHHSSERRSWGSFKSYRKWLQLRTGLPGRLWTLYAVIMTIFFVFRMPYTFPDALQIKLLRSEYYSFRVPLNKLFLWLHLVTVLPSGLLAVFQFAPGVRARAMSFHRTAGKVINILTFVSATCAWGMARVSYGGDLAIQAGTYLVGAMILWSTVASWRAIRRLQIDEHRIWMIRVWSYQTCIMTLRLCLFIGVIGISLAGGFYQSMSCQEVAYTLNNATMYAYGYPQCQEEWTGPPVTHVSIEANLTSSLGVASATRQAFGMSIWVAAWVHSIGAEYYIYRTRDESARLRDISTKRQNARRLLEERQRKDA